MLFQNAEGREKDRGPSGLSALEIEAIDMFINFLKIIGLQRSIGEIYGLLFVSAKPLSMDDIANRLDISLGRGEPGAETFAKRWGSQGHVLAGRPSRSLRGRSRVEQVRDRLHKRGASSPRRTSSRANPVHGIAPCGDAR